MAIVYSMDDFYEIKNQYSFYNPSLVSEETREALKRIQLIHQDSNYNRKDQEMIWRKKKPAHLLKKNSTPQEQKYLQQLNGELNKISIKTYLEVSRNIRKILIQIGSEGEVRPYLNVFLENLFEKATSQESYCQYYVKVILDLEQQGIIQEFIDQKKNGYAKLLEETLPVHSDEQFHSFSKHVKTEYDAFCHQLKIKNLQRGFSQFIGELFNNGQIQIQDITYFYQQLVSNIEYIIRINRNEVSLTDENANLIEENVVHLSELIKITLDRLVVGQLLEKVFQEINKLSENNIIPIRLRFKLKDLIDLFTKKNKPIRSDRSERSNQSIPQNSSRRRMPRKQNNPVRRYNKASGNHKNQNHQNHQNKLPVTNSLNESK